MEQLSDKKTCTFFEKSKEKTVILVGRRKIFCSRGNFLLNVHYSWSWDFGNLWVYEKLASNFKILRFSILCFLSFALHFYEYDSLCAFCFFFPSVLTCSLESGPWSVSGTWTLSAHKNAAWPKWSLPKRNWHESLRTDEAKATKKQSHDIHWAPKNAFKLILILQFVFLNFNLNFLDLQKIV